MGKTWTCMRLSQILEKNGVPNFYLDLRRFSEAVDYDRQHNFKLEEIIDRVLGQVATTASDQEPPTAAEVID